MPDACTLPTAEQPLRVAEFDELFRTSVRAVDRTSPTTAVLHLDSAAEQTARDLAERETACCSFFDFTFEPAGPDQVTIRISVPAARSAVLEALADRAVAAAGTSASLD